MSAEWVGVIGGVTGITVSLFVAVIQIRARWRESLKAKYSEALADTLLWIEFVYRIRRRGAGEEDRVRIVRDMHEAQIRITHHLNWLRIESVGVHVAYVSLVAAVKSTALEPMREGWNTPAPSKDSEMNLGVSVQFNFGDEADAYVSAVRKQLSWYLLKLWN